MQYMRPILGVLRWEGVLLVGALGLAIISNLATRWFLGFIFLAAVILVHTALYEQGLRNFFR